MLKSILLLSMAAIFSVGAQANENIDITSNTSCESCHAKEDIQARTPKGATQALFVDAHKQHNGTHGALECVECHQAKTDSLDDYENVPHRLNEAVQCDSCHEQYFDKQQAEFEQSVHAQRVGEEFACQTCHDPHTMGAATWKQEKQPECIGCHTKKITYESMATEGKKVGEQDLAHVNALPFPERHLESLTCLDCHASMGQSHKIEPKENTVACEQCHSKDSLLAKAPNDNNAGRFLNKGYFDDHKLVESLKTLPDSKAQVDSEFLDKNRYRQALYDGYLLGKYRIPVLETAFWIIFFLLLVGIGIHGYIRYRNHVAPEQEEKKHYLYTLPVRLWHWLNAGLFIALLITGLFTHYGLSPFEISVSIHHVAGFALIAAWVLFVFVGIFGNGHHYIPKFSSLIKDLFIQTKYYFSGIFNNAPHPFHSTKESKFNPLQQLGYIVIMYALMPLLLISGVLLYWPELLPEQIFSFDGKLFVVTLHSVLAMCSLLFLAVHLYLITTGRTPTSLIKGMKDGYHRE